MYIIEKRFTHGILRGMTIKEKVNYYIRPGHYKACVGSTEYDIISCVPGTVKNEVGLDNEKEFVA